MPLTAKQEASYERMNLKILDHASETTFREIEKQFDDFKSKNKGKSATLEEIDKRFTNYLDNVYF